MSLEQLFITFSNNLLPILLISAGGFLAGKWLGVEPRPLGRLAFYIFLPTLIFNLLIHTEVAVNDVAKIAGVVTSVVLINGLLAFGISRLMGLDRQITAAVVVTSMFANAGNYGLPLVKFAFGDQAAAFASIHFVTSSLLFNSVGVLVSSLGHMNFKQALLGLFKIPMLYAVALAIGLNASGTVLPQPIDRAVGLLASGALPLMIIILGIELSKIQASRNIGAVGVSAGLRMLLGPVLALILASWLGLTGPARQGVVTESSMPPAVNNIVLAGEYKLDTAFVTTIVFISTILSPLTLTPLLVFLGSHP